MTHLASFLPHSTLSHVWPTTCFKAPVDSHRAHSKLKQVEFMPAARAGCSAIAGTHLCSRTICHEQVTALSSEHSSS